MVNSLCLEEGARVACRVCPVGGVAVVNSTLKDVANFMVNSEGADAARGLNYRHRKLFYGKLCFIYGTFRLARQLIGQMMVLI